MAAGVEGYQRPVHTTRDPLSNHITNGWLYKGCIDSLALSSLNAPVDLCFQPLGMTPFVCL
jgi:hypothetical protein